MKERKIFEKYIETIEYYLKTGFDIRPEDKRKMMEFVSEAYEKIGDTAESVAWRARAMAEQVAYSAQSDKKSR